MDLDNEVIRVLIPSSIFDAIQENEDLEGSTADMQLWVEEAIAGIFAQQFGLYPLVESEES